MCRFVTYLGVTPVVLSRIIEKPNNSLIKQSKSAKEGVNEVNADGFGIGWYKPEIDNTPGTFKSIQPAWADDNLISICNKIQSCCFAGHIRASTVGGVNVLNCQPFHHRELMFVHNGTIFGFNNIKRQVQAELNDEYFDLIKGHTDSEHFFALLCQNLSKFDELNTESMSIALQKSISFINQLEEKNQETAWLNIMLTDGKNMVVSRYVSQPDTVPLSLYYTYGHGFTRGNKNHMVKPNDEKQNFVLIASEMLSDYVDEWIEIPHNHMMLVDEKLNTIFRPISLD